MPGHPRSVTSQSCSAAEAACVIAGAATSFGRALSLSNDRVIAGSALYDAPAFAAVGRVTGESNCIRQRSPAQLACLTIADFFKPEVRILPADPASFVLRASLPLAASEPPDQLKRTFVEGPNGQVAVSYSAYAAFSASPSGTTRPAIAGSLPTGGASEVRTWICTSVPGSSPARRTQSWSPKRDHDAAVMTTSPVDGWL